MTALHRSALASLTAWTPPDAEQGALRAEYVRHLETHPDGMWRTCTPDHITASVLVMSPDAEQVLLALHAKAGRWFQLGGHLERGDGALAAGALREGREESGINALELVGAGPLLLDVHPAPCSTPGALRHLDVQYLATSPTSAVPTVSDESLDVRWFPVDSLPADADGSVRALVAAGVRHLTGQVSSESPRLAALEKPSR